MTKTKKKPSKTKTKKQSILDAITPDDAASILKALAEEDTNMTESRGLLLTLARNE